jgi:hypothetical protein
MRLLWQRSLCFGYWRIWCGIQLYIEQPFWSSHYLYFCIDWYGWSAGLHYYKRWCNCSCGTTGTVSVPTTADTIDEVTENFSIAWAASATGTIIDNNACGNDHSCFGYWRIWCGIQLYIEQPFCSQDITYTFVLTNGTAGSAITLNVDVLVPAGATTGTVGTNNCGYDWWSNWKL